MGSGRSGSSAFIRFIKESYMKRIIYIFLFSLAALVVMAKQDKPVRLGIIGLTHSHVGGVLNDTNKPYVIAGIVEPDLQLAERMSKRFGFSMEIVYPTLQELYDKQRPEAVACFNATYYHLDVVRFFAPKRVHIMVEKPLATNSEQAKEMAELATRHQIHLLTNYETTWYGSHEAAAELIRKGEIGEIRKAVFRDGHTGPVERNTHPEMIPWIKDPVLNGGGAVMDFGCYGANLMTWLMGNRKPVSVVSAFQTIKPDQYPEVEDQATVILTYPKAQCILEASWNWPINMKTSEIYGKTGYIQIPDKHTLLIRTGEKSPVRQISPADRPAPYDNPYSYFCAVVKGEASEDPQSTLENNLIVMEILDAAKESAKSGNVIYLK